MVIEMLAIVQSDKVNQGQSDVIEHAQNFAKCDNQIPFVRWIETIDTSVSLSSPVGAWLPFAHPQSLQNSMPSV